ncbi:unnamed protein product [Bemisia tabaci]|uniref:Ionotropic receptor n=1 Tax=Bemisia tabaci TaxID=7038 RepID=A0A9P0AIN3_BEMTA|nr:unnamed protein product [Bemisia tabaci]
MVCCVPLGIETKDHWSVATSEDQFLKNVCDNTRERSKLKTFHIVSLNPDYDLTPLMIDLGEQLVPSVLTHFHGSFDHFPAANRAKNILFILNDANDILNLILGTGSGSDSEDTTGADRNIRFRQDLTNNYTQRQLPNYCIMYTDSNSQYVIRDEKRGCDVTFQMSENDLKENSVLPEDVFQHVKRLYLHDVWNPDNFLIFKISRTNRRSTDILGQTWSLAQNFNSTKGSDSICPNDKILVSLKFIWRAFRGHKTVICCEEICYWYEPFHEVIYHYAMEEKNDYFDFSWMSMNDKLIKVAFPLEEENLISVSIGWNFWGNSMGLAIDALAEKRKGTPNYWVYMDEENDTMWPVPRPLDLKTMVKLGYDFLATKYSGYCANFSEFDPSPGIETAVLFIIVPRKGFLPSDLAVFRCFTPTVWLCTMLAMVTFFSAYYLYNKLQIRAFPLLYSQEELIHFKRVSISLTLFRNVLCMSQPRWTLGELKAGKIVFFVISFSTLIMTSLFASGMVSVLSEPVRYSDIDTLRELNQSSMDVQTDTSWSKDRAELFAGDSELKWLNQKLRSLFQFEFGYLYEARTIQSSVPALKEMGAKVTNWSEQVLNTSINETITTMGRNSDAMMKSDAFLVEVTASFAERRNIILKQVEVHAENDFHFIREYITKHPFMYLMSKRSFYRDAVNDILTRLFESGVLGLDHKRRLDGQTLAGNWRPSPVKSEEETPRPFSLTDLRIAFIVLGFGLNAGVTAFILELLCMI